MKIHGSFSRGDTCWEWDQQSLQQQCLAEVLLSNDIYVHSATLTVRSVWPIRDEISVFGVSLQLAVQPLPWIRKGERPGMPKTLNEEFTL